MKLENCYVKGDRIGQLIVMPYPQVLIEEVTELCEHEQVRTDDRNDGAA